MFLKHVADIPKPIVVFFDGHGSHITYDTAFKAKEANVHICLPPHTSSALQSLDVGVYGPAKKVWYQILQKFYRESRQHFCKEAFVKKPNNIPAGFNKAGLCPLDKERVPKSKIRPSSTLIPVSTSTPTRTPT